MGVLDDILGTPPEQVSPREWRREFLLSSIRVFFFFTGWIVGPPLVLLILITLFY